MTTIDKYYPTNSIHKRSGLKDPSKEKDTNSLFPVFDRFLTPQKDPQEALYEAVKNGRTWEVKALIEKGAKVNLVGDDGLTPLNLACLQGDTKMIKLLIKKGAIVNDSPRETGSLSLMIAAKNGSIKDMEILLEAGADPESPNSGGESLLYIASYMGDAEIVDLLLRYHADPSIQVNGYTPLVTAYMRGYTDVVSLLPWTAYDEAFMKTKLLGHAFHLEGISTLDGQQFEIERDLGPYFFFHHFANALATFESPFEVETSELRKALEKGGTDRPSHELLEDIQKGELTFVSAGWKGHTIQLMFKDDFLVIANRGEREDEIPSVLVYKIDPTKLVEEDLDRIKEITSKEPYDVGHNFYYQELITKLDGEELPSIEGFEPKDQITDNCSYAAIVGALRFAWAVTNKGLKQDALKVAKAFSLHAALSTYQFFEGNERVRNSLGPDQVKALEATKKRKEEALALLVNPALKDGE